MKYPHLRLSALLLLAVLAAPSAGAQVPAVTVPSQRTTAQDVAQQRYGRAMSNQDIANAIQQSGLSQADLRARLQQAGLDPGLADPFFSQQGLSSVGAAAPADSQFVSTLSAMGILGGTGPTGLPTPIGAASGTSPSTSGITDLAFGRGIFERRTTLFDPVTSGPIDGSYRLGPGDQVQIVFTGDVENAYQGVLGRDGSVLLPQLGQVPLGGLTLEAARGLLKQRAGRVYSGITTGRTRVDLTVAEIRTNVVYVLGEVAAPGAYQVNALSTVLHAIARAGGPTERGTLRSIELRRAGRLVRTVDVYPFLLTGDVSEDVRTEQGDVIYVPLQSRSVEVRGAFRRPAIFELRSNEGFGDLMRFAGGLNPTASTERLHLDRILPPAERTPAHERVAVDLPLRLGLAALDTTTLVDGDVLTAYDIGDLQRNVVAVLGEVHQGGEFEWTEGLRLGDLIGRAQGPKPWGLMDRVKVRRQVRQTGKSETYSLDLETTDGRNFPVQEFDTVTVLDARALYPGGPVRVLGAINRPGMQAFSQGLTVQDAIDLGGGLKEGAATVEISRRRIGDTYTDTSAVIRRLDVAADGQSVLGADTTALERFDIVMVRYSPGYRIPQTVTLEGEFAFPGTYTLLTDGERLSSIVDRAGGLLPIAFPESFRLIRNGRPVALSFANALRRKAGDDVILEPGDQLSIGRNPSIVQVSGAVQRQVSVPFRRGWSMRDYIDAAGGLAENANDSKRFVEYASGAVARPHRVLFIFGGDPDIRPGAVITVPERAPKTEGSNFGQVFASTFQVVATLTSLAIAYLAATK